MEKCKIAFKSELTLFAITDYLLSTAQICKTVHHFSI